MNKIVTQKPTKISTNLKTNKTYNVNSIAFNKYVRIFELLTITVTPLSTEKPEIEVHIYENVPVDPTLKWVKKIFGEVKIDQKGLHLVSTFYDLETLSTAKLTDVNQDPESFIFEIYGRRKGEEEEVVADFQKNRCLVLKNFNIDPLLLEFSSKKDMDHTPVHFVKKPVT